MVTENQRVFSDEQITVKILYKNHRGEISWRTIMPQGLWFGSSQWHPTDQWILAAFDYDKNERRDFAMKDIRKWKELGE